MADKPKRTKVPRYYWFRPYLARALREYTERERRAETEQVEMFIEEALERRGVSIKESANPQSRTRRVGRVRKVVPMVLAALVAGSASQLRADSRVSTFVRGQNDPLLSGPSVCIIRSWKRKVRRTGETARDLDKAA